MNPESQWIFLRLLSLIYALTYFSFIKEVRGLFGPRGIGPIGLSNGTLMALVYIGFISSIISFIGFYPTPFLFICWIIYFHFSRKDTTTIMVKHWENFLLEVGFFSIFYSAASPPPFYMALVIPVFLFRFFLSAGLFKFFSPSQEWKDLNAMKHYFEIQPLPNRIAYYCHQLSDISLKMGTIFATAPFLLIPIFIFTPYSYIAFIIIAIHQTLIFTTGNFPWFNLLVIITSIPLLTIDNPYIPLGTTFAENPYLTFFLNSMGILIIALNVIKFLLDFFKWFPKLNPFGKKSNFVYNFYYDNLRFFVNSYHLFSVMVIRRSEIIIEGSYDGKKWKAYKLKGITGDMKQPPPQIAPLYYRLYWLPWRHRYWNPIGDYYPVSDSWFINFLGCLLEGVPEVTDLLAYNPFPDKPPVYVRVHHYHYRFTSLEKKRKTGKWWERSYIGLLCPVYKLQTYVSPLRKKINRRPIVVDLEKELKQSTPLL